LNIFGYELSLRRKDFNSTPHPISAINSWIQWPSGPYNIVTEPFSGAWQRNTIAVPQTSLTNSAVYACTTGISSDVAKMCINLCRIDDNGIWNELNNPTDSPWLRVLRKPNNWQNRIQFFENWLTSKLLYGNTYVLKERNDARGLVTALHILHPRAVYPLVTELGEVYYEIRPDNLAGIIETITVPASEIIHDRMNPIWHPLVGVSPIYACAMSATMGSTITTNSTSFFHNKSSPGGMLTAPGLISKPTADRLKSEFETQFSGANIGKLFVAGDGLKFEPFTMPAEQAQLIEQLKWTVEDIARAFRYPLWKLGGPMPPYTKPDLAQTAYFSDCLQPYIEAVELCLDEGLELPYTLGTEFEVDDLLRMDQLSLFESNKAAAGWMKIDEMRERANLPPTPGGDTVYLQQQNFSLEALAKRDAQDDPFARASTVLPPSAVDSAASDAAAVPIPPATPAPAPPAKSVDDDRSAVAWTREYYDALDEVLSE
jgi:HK97 family phage portal protein